VTRTRLLALLAAATIAAAAWLYTPDRPRAALEAAYPADYRTVAGLHLRLRDEGPRSAPAIILLHGFGSSLQTWDAWTLTLAANHRVIRFDLPGFGLTGPDPTGDYSDTRAVAIIAALMDQLGLPRATIAGNSMGGRIAWQFAAAHPDRTDKLILISPDGFASPDVEYDRAPDVPLIMRALPYTAPRFLLKANIEPAYADAARLTPATVQRYWDMLRAPGVRAAILLRTPQEILHDPIPRLRSIQAPTLILWGEHDEMIPFSNSADFLRAIPHARLVALPTLGHVPFEEAPAESLAPVLKLLG
jgi:pimeloyl-ACP methyl ester carboxylesterase